MGKGGWGGGELILGNARSSHWQDFIAGTGHREASANTKLLQIEEAQATQWDQWKQRIAELRNAILEHPNVDSSALGIFDRDALEVPPLPVGYLHTAKSSSGRYPRYTHVMGCTFSLQS